MCCTHNTPILTLYPSINQKKNHRLTHCTHNTPILTLYPSINPNNNHHITHCTHNTPILTIYPSINPNNNHHITHRNAPFLRKSPSNLCMQNKYSNLLLLQHHQAYDYIDSDQCANSTFFTVLKRSPSENSCWLCISLWDKDETHHTYASAKPYRTHNHLHSVQPTRQLHS